MAVIFGLFGLPYISAYTCDFTAGRIGRPFFPNFDSDSDSNRGKSVDLVDNETILFVQMSQLTAFPLNMRASYLICDFTLNI